MRLAFARGERIPPPRRWSGEYEGPVFGGPGEHKREEFGPRARTAEKTRAAKRMKKEAFENCRDDVLSRHRDLSAGGTGVSTPCVICLSFVREAPNSRRAAPLVRFHGWLRDGHVSFQCG